MAAAKGKTRVARFERLLHVLLEGFLEIEKDNFAPRRHDVADDTLAEIEGIHEQIAPKFGDLFRLFALVEDEAKLFFAVRQLVLAHRLESKCVFEDPVGRAVEKPYSRLENDVDNAERPGNPKRGRK